MTPDVPPLTRQATSLVGNSLKFVVQAVLEGLAAEEAAEETADETALAIVVEVYYSVRKPVELRNSAEGAHLVRVCCGSLAALVR